MTASDLVKNRTKGADVTAIEDTIATLETKLRQAKAKKQQIEARKRALEAKEKRAQDTRRKILVGATILAKVERGEWPQDKLLKMLDTALTRTDDRALFGLHATDIKPEASYDSLIFKQNLDIFLK